MYLNEEVKSEISQILVRNPVPEGEEIVNYIMAHFENKEIMDYLCYALEVRYFYQRLVGVPHIDNEQAN